METGLIKPAKKSLLKAAPPVAAVTTCFLFELLFHFNLCIEKLKDIISFQ